MAASRRRARPRRGAGRWRQMIALGGPCHYCGDSRSIQNDHFIPRARGGADDMGNIVPACRPCNLEKSDLYLHEWYSYRLAIGACWPPVWSEEDHAIWRQVASHMHDSRKPSNGPRTYSPDGGRLAAVARWSNPDMVDAVSGGNHWSKRKLLRDRVVDYVSSNGPVSRREIAIVLGVTYKAAGSRIAEARRFGQIVRIRPGFYDVA